MDGYGLMMITSSSVVPEMMEFLVRHRADPVCKLVGTPVPSSHASEEKEPGDGRENENAQDKYGQEKQGGSEEQPEQNGFEN